METKDLPDLLDDQGQVFSFKDKKDIVIYFYPKDDTPG
jgi:peroxiredoxin